MAESCDGWFEIPQFGMVSSLNVSVACAVTLYELLRQRTFTGLYEGSRMPEDRSMEIMRRWSGDQGC
jgi:tRNA (guanosine-2'-O-)-methyltransferase